MSWDVKPWIKRHPGHDRELVLNIEPQPYSSGDAMATTLAPPLPPPSPLQHSQLYLEGDFSAGRVIFS